MKKCLKWILVGITAVVMLLVIALSLYLKHRPAVESIPAAYTKAEMLWNLDESQDNAEKVIKLAVGDATASVGLKYMPVGGVDIQYSDEDKPRELFPEELYFGAKEFRYDEGSGIVYLMVVGQNPTSPYGGKRIFEFDARSRKPIHDYWVEVRD